MRMQLGVAHQQEIAEGTLGTAVADDVVVGAHGIDHGAQAGGNTFDLIARGNHGAGRFMAERPGLAALAQKAELGKSEIAAADAAGVDFQQHILGADLWRGDFVDTNVSRTMNVDYAHNGDSFMNGLGFNGLGDARRNNRPGYFRARGPDVILEPA